MQKQLLYGGIIAAVIIIAVIALAVLSGFLGARPIGSSGPAGTGTPGAYIRIDPLPDRTTGELLIVTGTTDLPAGTILLVATHGAAADTFVRAGTGGVNRFSSPIDTTILNPGELKITVLEMKGSPGRGDYGPGILNATSACMLTGVSRVEELAVQPTPGRHNYIRIDPVGTRTAGDQFLVTGNTSLPAGTNIFWTVIRDAGMSGNSMGSMFGEKAGQPRTYSDIITASSVVTKGSDAPNHVTYALDTGALRPGNYTVSASLLVGDPALHQRGEPSGSVQFAVV